MKEIEYLITSLSQLNTAKETPPSPLKEGEVVLDKKEGATLGEKLIFSLEAIAVFNAGRELWKYYHSQPNCNVNASLYDIREYFQGRNDKGKMNNKSSDETYMQLIGNIREKLKLLAEKIEPKVYKYEFLKQ